MAESLLTGLVCSSIVLVEHNIVSDIWKLKPKTNILQTWKKLYTNLGFYSPVNK